MLATVKDMSTNAMNEYLKRILDWVFQEYIFPCKLQTRGHPPLSYPTHYCLIESQIFIISHVE